MSCALESVPADTSARLDCTRSIVVLCYVGEQPEPPRPTTNRVNGAHDNKHRREIVMLPEKQLKAYNDFYDSARHNEILEPKTTLMIHLAAAMAVACYP